MKGITRKQKDSLLLFTCSEADTKEWNYCSWQSRGLIMDLRSPGGCVMYGFNHSVSLKKPSWPLDSLSSPSHNSSFALIAVFVHNNILQFVGEDGFDTEDAKRAKTLSAHYDLNSLSFEKYFHILALDNSSS